MSTKSTIFLTKDNEHCYLETCEIDAGQFRLYLEIDTVNIKSIEYDQMNGLIIGIKGDSELAEYLKKKICQIKT